MFLKSLSGRFLVLTTVFVVLAEVLIFVPSVARFREDYLLRHLEKAQIASLALLADNMLSEKLEAELLRNAGVFNVVLLREEARQLVLSSEVPSPVVETFDLRHYGAPKLIGDSVTRLASPRNDVIRVIGQPLRGAGQQIEITIGTAPLRMAMIDYGIRISVLSAGILMIASVFLFVTVRLFMVRPIRRVVQAMSTYAEAPEDARRIIEPSAGISELREAESALASMQMHVTAALRQKERLAQLGGAVAKISHDLRNILSVAQLSSDRLQYSEDPGVKRSLPRLVNSLSRAVNLCESTLAFGKAEEPPPRLDHVMLAGIVDDVIEEERLASEGTGVTLISDVPAGMSVRADSEQLYRVIGNLVRNARQAINASGRPGRISLTARETNDEWRIHVEDSGPGLPARAREHLFQPFQGGVRRGGIGLGLAISSELVKGHGGRLELLSSGPDGTVFAVFLPKTVAVLADIPE